MDFETGARSRPRQRVNVHAQVTRDHFGKALQRRIELRDHRFRSAFLRTVHSGGTLWTGERVADVARHFDFQPPPGRIDPRGVDAVEPGQCDASARQLPALRVEQAITDGLSHARASVIRRRTADARDHGFHARAARSVQDLPETVGGRDAGVAPVSCDKRQPRARSQLDNRRGPVIDDAVGCLNPLAQRSFDTHFDQPSRVRSDQRVDGAFAAVGDRDLAHLGLRKDRADAALDGGSRCRGAEAALERIRCRDELEPAAEARRQ